MKVQKMISLDEETARQVKEKDLNLSQYCNESLRQYLVLDGVDVEKVNVELTRSKLLSLQKKSIKLNVEMRQLRNILKVYDELQEERKEKVLLAKKQHLEQKQKCKQCGLVPMGKTHKFKIGIICDSCFKTQSKGNINRWMKPK